MRKRRAINAQTTASLDFGLNDFETQQGFRRYFSINYRYLLLILKSN